MRNPLLRWASGEKGKKKIGEETPRNIMIFPLAAKLFRWVRTAPLASEAKRKIN